MRTRCRRRSTAYAGLIDIAVVDPRLLISKGLTLYDGTVAAGGNRYEAATIAKYEFKTGMGGIAYDTSGLEPALNLTLSGDVSWVGGWGINIKAGGKAQGSASASKKLTDLIKSTGEFTIEAWVNNANVAQEDAYIVSYSAGTDFAQCHARAAACTSTRRTRAATGPTATAPRRCMTRAADEDAQAALQHVVMTYSPVEGRRIYVNGMYTGDADARGGGSLADWDDTFALVLGNETSTDRQWEGVMRMVAIHNRALTPTQILQNFDAGVGEKYFMLFNVSHLVPEVPQAYVMLEATQLDSYGLQFTKPTFISLAPNATVTNVPIAGIRIGVNGGELRAGQAYVPLSATVGGANYTAGAGQELSRVGTVAAIDKNVVDDVFFLSFERIGALTDDPDAGRSAGADRAGTPADLEAESDVGLRTFDELNATLVADHGCAADQRPACATPTRWSSRHCRRSRSSAPSVPRSRRRSRSSRCSTATSWSMTTPCAPRSSAASTVRAPASECSARAGEPERGESRPAHQRAHEQGGGRRHGLTRSRRRRSARSC